MTKNTASYYKKYLYHTDNWMKFLFAIIYYHRILPTIEQHLFYYFDEYRGHHRKGVAIYTATEVNVHKKYGFIQQKCIFED
jgi:hypothetical protein